LAQRFVLRIDKISTTLIVSICSRSQFSESHVLDLIKYRIFRGSFMLRIVLGLSDVISHAPFATFCIDGKRAAAEWGRA
jgi:hypothetical protein